MKEIVTAELKARICELFERHDKIVEEQDEYIEQLRKTIKQLQSENTRLRKELEQVKAERDNKTHVKKSDFDILTVADYVARYPNSEFSKKVKEQWRGLEESE